MKNSICPKQPRNEFYGNKVRENSSRYRGEVRADAELKKEDKNDRS